MIGLALVTLVAVLAAGITRTFNGAVDDLWPWRATRSRPRTTSRRSRSAPANAAAKTPGVEAVANVRAGDAHIFGRRPASTAVDPDGRQVFNLDWIDGVAAR